MAKNIEQLKMSLGWVGVVGLCVCGVWLVSLCLLLCVSLVCVVGVCEMQIKKKSM